MFNIVGLDDFHAVLFNADDRTIKLITITISFI